MLTKGVNKMNRLKELRKEKGLTQKDLSDEMGVSKRTYIYWENGESQIKPDKAQALANFFNVSVAELLNIKENIPPYPYDTYTPREEKFWIEYNQHGINKTNIPFDTYLTLKKRGVEISDIIEKVVEPSIENVKALYDLLNDETFKENLELQKEAYTVLEKHLNNPKKFEKLALNIVHHPSFMIYLKGLIDFDKEDKTNEADLLINYLMLDEVDKEITFDLIQKLSDRNIN